MFGKSFYGVNRRTIGQQPIPLTPTFNSPDAASPLASTAADADFGLAAVTNQPLIRGPQASLFRKFSAPPSPLDTEARMSHFEAPPQVMRTQKDKIYERLLKDASVDGAKTLAIEIARRQNLDASVTAEVNDEFVASFNNWLVKRGRRQDHIRSGWWDPDKPNEVPKYLSSGGLLSNHPSVKSYVKDIVLARLDFSQRLLQLKVEAQTAGTADWPIDKMYLYYKYVVRGLEPDDEDVIKYNNGFLPTAQKVPPKHDPNVPATSGPYDVPPSSTPPPSYDETVTSGYMRDTYAASSLRSQPEELDPEDLPDPDLLAVRSQLAKSIAEKEKGKEKVHPERTPTGTFTREERQAYARNEEHRQAHMESLRAENERIKAKLAETKRRQKEQQEALRQTMLEVEPTVTIVESEGEHTIVPSLLKPAPETPPADSMVLTPPAPSNIQPLSSSAALPPTPAPAPATPPQHLIKALAQEPPTPMIPASAAPDSPVDETSGQLHREASEYHRQQAELDRPGTPDAMDQTAVMDSKIQTSTQPSRPAFSRDEALRRRAGDEFSHIELELYSTEDAVKTHAEAANTLDLSSMDFYATIHKLNQFRSEQAEVAVVAKDRETKARQANNQIAADAWASLYGQAVAAWEASRNVIDEVMARRRQRHGAPQTPAAQMSRPLPSGIAPATPQFEGRFEAV